MTIMFATRADAARQESDRVSARIRTARYHALAEQRRFELRVDAEVRASIESIFQELCAEPIREAVLANQRNVIIDIQTSYYREPEPIPQEYWWKAGVRCKAIVKYLSVYLRQEGFTVQEREQYYTRTYRGARPGTGLHAVPLTILW